MITSEADEDLDQIHDFIAGDNPIRARAYVLEVIAACAKLGDMPELGRLRDDLGEGRRSFSFRKRQTILYQVRADKIEILRIFSAGQDLGALLGED
nr:type II toxin-antitoxin system RelE/ParE family toxin [Tianweitania aestuarii]